jgi:hypothetical protein
VRKARAAVVNISEGHSRLRIDLTAQQLASGSVMYFPRSPDIAFDMELRGPAVNVSESVRAVVPGVELPPPEPALEARLLETPGFPLPEPAPRTEAYTGTAHRTARRVPEPRRSLSFVPPARPPAPLPAIDAPPALAAALPATPVPAPRPRNITVTYEPAPPSRLARFMGRIPIVRGLQETTPAGKDYVPAAPLRVTKPVVPPGLSLEEPGEAVQLKILIDEAGWVMRTEPLTNASLASRFAAGSAEWRFKPARLNGKPVASEMLMQFKFEP